MNGKAKLHYGWITMVVCFVTIFTALGLVNSPHGLYMVPVTKDLGMSRMEFSFISTFRYAASMIFNFVFGYFTYKYGLKRIGITGLLCLTGALLFFSYSSGPVMFYFGGIFWGIGTAFASTAFVSALISNWFHKHCGLVLGIVLCASGLGGVCFIQLVTLWISNFGWRFSYRVSAGVVAACALLVVFTIYETPAEKGLLPVGGNEERVKKVQVVKSNATKGLKDALRSPVFYIIAISSFFIGFLNNPIYVSVPAQIADQGLPVSVSAMTMSILFLSVAISKIILGWVHDCFGYMVTLVICFASNIIGFVLLLISRTPYYYYLFAAVFGCSIPMENLMVPLTVSQVFRDYDFKTFVGIALALVFLGMAVGNPLMGLCYDHWHNYRNAFIFCLLLSCTVFAVMFCAVKNAQSSKKNKV